MLKRCPKCGQTFADQNLNFCLNDGELLMYEQGTSRPLDDEPPPTKFADDDSPPTLMMNSPRETNPVGWPQSSPPAQWHGQQIATPPGHLPIQYASGSSPNQVLAILSIILGAGSVTVGWCCSSGLLLGPAAIILGIVAMIQNKNNPEAYGGRGLAIGGIVLGGIFLLGYILLIIIYGLAMISGSLN